MSSDAGKPTYSDTPRLATFRQPAGARGGPNYRPSPTRERAHEETTGTEDSTAEPRRYPEDRPRPHPVPAPETDTDSESDSSDEEAWADAQEEADGEGKGGDSEEGGGVQAEEGNGGQEAQENNEAENELRYVDDDFDFDEFINYVPPDFASPGYVPPAAAAAAAAFNIRPDYDDTRDFLILTSRSRYEPIAAPLDLQPLSSLPSLPSRRVSLYNQGVNLISHGSLSHRIAPGHTIDLMDPFFNFHHAAPSHPTNPIDPFNSINHTASSHTVPHPLPYNHTFSHPHPLNSNPTTAITTASHLPTPPFEPIHTLPHPILIPIPDPLDPFNPPHPHLHLSTTTSSSEEEDLHTQELHLQARLHETRLRAAALRRQIQIQTQIQTAQTAAAAAARYNHTVQMLGYCPGCVWCGDRWASRGGGRESLWGFGGSGGGRGASGNGGWDGRWAWPGMGRGGY